MIITQDLENMFLSDNDLGEQTKKTQSSVPPKHLIWDSDFWGFSIYETWISNARKKILDNGLIIVDSHDPPVGIISIFMINILLPTFLVCGELVPPIVAAILSAIIVQAVIFFVSQFFVSLGKPRLPVLFKVSVVDSMNKIHPLTLQVNGVFKLIHYIIGG